MPRYEVRFSVPVELVVTIDAEDEDAAADDAWQRANEYAQTVFGNMRDVRADLNLDGIGADSVKALGGTS